MGEAEVVAAMRRHDRLAPRALVPRAGEGYLFPEGANVAITAAKTIELVPVMRERLADLETPVSAFAKLRPLGGAFLLESAEGGERMGRFSFIGLAPREVVHFADGEDPVVMLRSTLSRYRRLPRPGLPRFSGGAVGFVSYEAARRFERLPLAANDPYAPWGMPEATFAIYDTVVAFDHLRHTLTVLAHDDADQPGRAAQMMGLVFGALDAPLPSLPRAAAE